MRRIVMVLFCSIAAFPVTTHALLLQVDPADQSVLLGTDASVNVVVSDLGGTLVGDFDFLLRYDPSVVEVADVAFGTGLGGPADAIQIVDRPSAGLLNLAEVSLLFDLSLLQDGVTDFILATIRFSTLAVGISDFTLLPNIAGAPPGFLGDEFGNPILLDGVGAGRIEVQPSARLDEPSQLLMFALGAGFLWLMVRRRAGTGLR